jgi:hypothetical protein
MREIIEVKSERLEVKGNKKDGQEIQGAVQEE